MTARKSFILHTDSLSVLDDLTDEQAGRLFKAIKAYQLSEECELDGLTKVAMSPFKAQFERDAKKYEEKVIRNRNNGLKGGRPKTDSNPLEPKKPTGFFENPLKAKKADSDSDSDSEVIEIVADSPSGSLESEKPQSKTKGSRIQPGWEMPQEWIDDAAERLSIDRGYLRRESERFADYWMAQPGSKGVKLNWQATWRNWVRNAVDRNPGLVKQQGAARSRPRAFGE